MREGYTNTVVGELPKDWYVKKIGEIATFRKGKKVNYIGTHEQGCQPVIGASSFEGKYENFTNSKDGIHCEPNEILMLWDGERSGLCSTGHQGIIGSTVSKITPTQEVYSKYLYYHLQKDFNWIQKNRTGSGIPHVPSTLPTMLWIALPQSKKEQQKIAEILSAVDEKIEVIAEQIENTQELKRGLIQQLLTKGIGHTQFKDSPLGKIPETWDFLPLQKIGSLTGGYAFSSKAFNTEGKGFQVIRMSNVQSYGLELNKTPVYLSEISAKEEKFLLDEGEVIITLTGTVGKTDYGNVAYIKEAKRYLLNQRVGRFMYDNNMDGKYIYYTFNSEYFKNQFFQKGIGGTGNQANVGKEAFESIIVSVPPLAEQIQIANFLTSVDEKLDILKDKKELYQELKKGLMQQLLTGKLRVNHLIEQPELA